jgi:hypothetical protein
MGRGERTAMRRSVHGEGGRCRSTDWLRFRILVAGAALLAGSGSAFPSYSATLTHGAPASGVIVQLRFTTWFDGLNTRHETHYQGETNAIHVTGDRGWSAYPLCGRVVTNLKWPSPPRSHAEATRQFFARMQGTNATKIGEEVFRGFPCWKYAEKLVRRSDDGDMLSEHTNHFLFLANPDFPVLIRQGSSEAYNTNADVLEIKLDCPVAPELFVCPANLKPTRSFQIPAVPFELELRQTRHSSQWNWATVTTNFLSSDGDTVTNRRVQFNRDAKGERPHGPTTDTKPFHQGIMVCNYPMGPPYWRSVRKVGEDTILGLKADVLDSTLLGRRYWVVDHPVLGAFSARWSMGGSTPETNEVLRLELRR